MQRHECFLALFVRLFFFFFFFFCSLLLLACFCFVLVCWFVNWLLFRRRGYFCSVACLLVCLCTHKTQCGMHTATATHKTCPRAAVAMLQPRVVGYTSDLVTAARDLLAREVGLAPMAVPTSMEAPNMRLLKLPAVPRVCRLAEGRVGSLTPGSLTPGSLAEGRVGSLTPGSLAEGRVGSLTPGSLAEGRVGSLTQGHWLREG